MSAGKTGFDVETEPGTYITWSISNLSLTRITVLVKGLDGKKIVQISCGQQHTIALDSEG